MKTLLTIIFTLYVSVFCFSQDENPERLREKIEMVKDNFRSDGLNKLDKIEGIYYLNQLEIIKDLDGETAFLNGTDMRNVYVVISRNENDMNRFDIFEYSEYFGGEFFRRTTNWFIRKEASDYFASCSDCLGIETSFYYESKVSFNNNGISWEEESRKKNSPGTFIKIFSAIQKIFPSTLEENIFKSGTGFFISQDGYLITNYHVIENSTNIYVSNKIYKRINAQVVFVDENNDIALLKVDVKLKSIPFNIVPTNKEIGNNVFTLGYPFIQTMGNEVKLTNGIINSSSGFKNDSRYYQFSAEIQPGNSGGPLFDSNGNIVGLVSAQHSAATNAGYALKSKFIIDFIKMNNPSILKTNINALKNLDLSAKYKLIQDYVILLEIE